MTRMDKLMGIDQQTAIQSAGAVRIIDSLAKAGDRAALQEIAAGADPVQVALARLTRSATEDVN